MRNHMRLVAKRDFVAVSTEKRFKFRELGLRRVEATP
jgi:hypothetical protein